MVDFIKVYYLVFGILTIVGGIIGFVKAKSRASLIAGVLCGVALIVAHFLLQRGNGMMGLIVGLVISALLGGKFIPKAMENRAGPHVIIMAVLSAVSLIVTLISFAKL